MPRKRGGPRNLRGPQVLHNRVVPVHAFAHSIVSLACTGWRSPPLRPAVAYDPQREAANFEHIGQRMQVEQADPNWYADVLENGLATRVDLLERDATSAATASADRCAAPGC